MRLCHEDEASALVVSAKIWLFWGDPGTLSTRKLSAWIANAVMKKFLVGVVVAGLLLTVVVLVRAFLHTPSEVEEIALVEISLDEQAIAARLSQAIRFRTVSHQQAEDFEAEQFTGFIEWVRSKYPEVNAGMSLTMAGAYTMLYRWEGSDPSLAPVLLTGHYDVVPVIPGTESSWEQPPFAGVIKDGVIWGRGALDDKSAVVAQLEAATELLRAGFKPDRTIYFSFGHDEEVGGTRGAASVVELLKGQGVQLAWSLDEGSFLFDGLLPGVEARTATINVAEKGSLTLQIVATGAGGHSSMPPRQTAVGVLAQAITALEAHPVPGGLSGLTGDMFDSISRHMSFGYKVLFANQWLFGGLLESQLSNSTFGNAMLRTTTAPTMLSGSVKTNVLPIEAIATVNFRVHPQDTAESVLAHVRNVVEDDQVTVRGAAEDGLDASAVSDWNAAGFGIIARAIRETNAGVVIAPGLMIAGSDTRHYGKIANNSYRFNPMVVTPVDLTGFHGTNEKIAVDNLANSVRTYMQIIRHAAGP